MKRFLMSLFAGIHSSGQASGRRDRCVRPCLETMEERLALSTTAPTALLGSVAMVGTPSPEEARGLIILGGRTAVTVTNSSVVPVSPAVIRGFNPQPEPPGYQGIDNPNLFNAIHK